MTEEVKSKEEVDEGTKKQEDWLQKKWRPMMAMMYMTVCFFDFVVFPIMFTVVQFWETQAANDAFRQWQPLTLVGAGLFHMAMGAVLGITAWGRTQEKVAGAAVNPSAPAGLGSMAPSLGMGSAPSMSSAPAIASPAPSMAFNSAPTMSASSFGAPKASTPYVKGQPIDPDNVFDRG
jgi:hypothetical protein